MIYFVLLLFPPASGEPKPEAPFITVNLENVTLAYGQRVRVRIIRLFFSVIRCTALPHMYVINKMCRLLYL